ncbi:UNVERIFIED_CONTAM: hypothetical protein GTU68_034679 [Idotea baltica]|nr:hypothetical protein [Idotea baltica]
MVGSWAGAIGQTQFMPTTYNEHAVDFDGDGKRNLWDSSTDALASAAHYLNKSGWKKNQPWGYEVILPKSFDYALATPNKKLTLKQWALMGVIPTYKQKKLPSETLASILLPAGYRGPSFIVFNNFSTLLKYNNSTSYALSVGLLSQRLALKPGIKAKWPKDTHQLNRKERVELQQKLSQCCHDVGTVDGVIGANTRKAIRSFQKGQGVPVDGYADYALLELLRNPIKTPSMKR